MSRIERAYLICATPRSGTTLLCDLLDGTGVAGHPAECFEALRSTGLPRQSLVLPFARAGRLPGLTGGSAPCEPPEMPEVVIRHDPTDVAARRLLEAIG